MEDKLNEHLVIGGTVKVTINVTKERVGAVLNQIQVTPAKIYPIAYFSKKHPPMEKKITMSATGSCSSYNYHITS